MIKFQDLKVGDYVLAEQDGNTWGGEVTNLNRDEKEICVDNGVQEFWFKSEELKPLPLDEAFLMKLNFQRHENEDGSKVMNRKGVRITTTIPANNIKRMMQIMYAIHHSFLFCHNKKVSFYIIRLQILWRTNISFTIRRMFQQLSILT